MRGLAVVLVLLYHAGVGAMPGGYVGVDVFFVISGFLITGLLTTELARTGRISLVGFWARRARRLLPAAGLVLVASLLLTMAALPPIRWAATARDIVAAGLYGVNWRLAAGAGDYLNGDVAPSIVQHYWSLAVEEQFYLCWPILLLLFGRGPVARWLGARRGLLVGIGAVAALSLAWSVHLVATDPAAAFFVSTTRLWELAAGGGLALLAPRVARLPAAVGAAVGWAGLAAVLAAAAVLDAATPFPGLAALLPTLGAVALIAAGTGAGARYGPAVLLGRAAPRAVGVVSYSLYLWHWPLLVAARAVLGPLSPAVATLVVAAAAVPAVLTYRYVENPVRRAPALARPGRAIAVGAACTALPLAVALILVDGHGDSPVPLSPAMVMPADRPGASVLADEPRGDPRGAATDRVARVFPDPLHARADLPAVYGDGCHAPQTGATVLSCRYGDPGAQFTVALVGDSHAAQWTPAMQAVTAANGWRLMTYTKSACPFLALDIARDGRPYTDCAAWNARLRERLLGPDRPDLLLVANSVYRPLVRGRTLTGPAGDAVVVDAARRTWGGMAAAGVATVVLRDTPRAGRDIAECASAHPDRLTRCAVARAVALAPGRTQERAVAGLRGVRLVDLNDAICPTDPCAPVIGSVLVYRDGHHLTATYALSLAPRLRTALAATIG
jgi:peptidoglycan/LPS O-acetylase OafA/YrhL